MDRAASEVEIGDSTIARMKKVTKADLIESPAIDCIIKKRYEFAEMKIVIEI